ncbi:unnamed protein product, partial [Mesorhabditis belari]|uniref:Uncharacterized protein n=1 Tax=Mesorhabditis belari TaxID=2138241 RepID=A0AAF3EBM5_9BILA
MATLNPGEKPMKPSHLNRFFDRIRGKKGEKNAQLENECNKENTLVMSNNRISKDDSAQHWKIAEPQSAKEKPRSPLQRLRQRLSLRRKTADRNDASHISSNEKIDDSGYKPTNGNSFVAPRSAVSENDVRFLCLSQDPITSSTITQNGHYRHHSKGAQSGVQSMSVDDVRDREASPFPAQPSRSPSYLKVSLGAHGYSTRSKVPLGELGCSLSNVERLRLVHQQQITGNMITTFGVEKPKTRTSTFEESPDMGNLTTRPVKALVAKIEDLSVCKGKSGDKSDDEENGKVHRPQLVIIQPLNEKEKPQKVVEMAEVNEIQGEEAEGRIFDQPVVAVAEVTEEASQIATQEAGVHEDFATKVLSSAEQIVEADTAKAVATVIQVLPKENLREVREPMESVNSGEQYSKKLDAKKHEYQALITSAAKDCKVLESDSKREEAYQILQESIASTQLFMNGKMKQYEGLIEKNLNPVVGDPCPVLVPDLAGWWDMLMIQFEKLDQKFALVEQIRQNNWEKPAEKVTTIEKKNNNNNVKMLKNKEPVTKEMQMKRDEANEKRKKMLAEARERAKANVTESQIFVSSTDN